MARRTAQLGSNDRQAAENGRDNAVDCLNDAADRGERSAGTTDDRQALNGSGHRANDAVCLAQEASCASNGSRQVAQPEA